MRKNIVPLFMSGLAVEDVFNANRDALVQLYTDTADDKRDKSSQPKNDGRKPFILSKLSNQLSKFRDGRHLPFSTSAITLEKKTDKAGRRVEVIRDLVRELFPTYQEYYETKGEGVLNLDRLLKDIPPLTKDECDAIQRLSSYSSEISNQYNNEWGVGRDLSIFPLDILERYLSDVHQLKTLPGFEELSTRIMGGGNERGILAPYTALGATTRWIFGEQIPLTSIFNFLHELDKSEGLDYRIADEFCLGINENRNIQIEPVTRENLSVLIKYQLSQEKATESPPKTMLHLAIESSDIFLQTDETIALLQAFSEEGLGFSDPLVNLFFKKKIFKQAKDFKSHTRWGMPNSQLLAGEFDRIDKSLTDNPELEVNENNWRILLLRFVRSQRHEINVPEESLKRIEEFFENPRVKDLCIKNLRKDYFDYLAEGNFDRIPFALYLTADFINWIGSAGHLIQIKSLSNFINVFCASLGKETATEESKNAAFRKMHIIETRFDKEKWSNESKTNFYNMSSDIITADPNVFFDYLELFNNLNPSDLKRFMREIYPLYGVQLALMEKTDEKGKKTYDAAQLVNLRKDVQTFTKSLKTKEKPLETQKAKLIGEISRLFKTRFNITRIPKEFTEENIRSLTNVSLYLANLNNRDATKETELGYYLSLMLNNKWDDFRRGETIDPKEFLDPKRAETITEILKKRAELSPLTPENLGLQNSDIPEFLRILQEETQNVAVGNIETIDVKLNNVILNLRQLEDPDLYPELLDKERMKLLLSFGNKKVGSTAAKMYQALQNPSKSIQFSEEEVKIKEEITRIARDGNLELTADNIKKHFQEGIRPLSTMVNMLQFVNEAKAEAEIGNIRQLLQPSQEIIDIFNRLGEEFKPTSGALALSQDLDYLDNIIVKKETSLSPNEKMLLSNYTGSIRGQVVKLQRIFDQIRNKFSSLKQGSTTRNQLLTDKLGQIEVIINAPSTQQTITSTMTNNLNIIVENMRECLSCTKKGQNNDTNLTFGDFNKFYLYSQSEGQAKGSISDEILFLEPITHQDGTSEMAFVFDRIYGAQTPTILINQLQTVIKKYRQLKQRFPKAKLSIFVTDSAIATAGLSQDMLISRVQNTGNNAYVKEEEVMVNVAESAMGDHYIEFGGDGRYSGKRNVRGVVIRF